MPLSVIADRADLFLQAQHHWVRRHALRRARAVRHQQIRPVEGLLAKQLIGPLRLRPARTGTREARRRSIGQALRQQHGARLAGACRPDPDPEIPRLPNPCFPASIIMLDSVLPVGSRVVGNEMGPKSHGTSPKLLGSAIIYRSQRLSRFWITSSSGRYA